MPAVLCNPKLNSEKLAGGLKDQIVCMEITAKFISRTVSCTCAIYLKWLGEFGTETKSVWFLQGEAEGSERVIIDIHESNGVDIVFFMFVFICT